MALRHPVDLGAWQRWDARRHLLRRIKAAIRTERPAQGAIWLATRGADAPVVAVLESRAASSVQALIAPLAHTQSGAVYAPFDPTPHLPGDGWVSRQVDAVVLARHVPLSHTVMSAGHFLPLGAAAYEQAIQLGLRFVVVQHGLLTPFTPPLPAQCHLLAWSEEDADYWRSNRDDLTTAVVGAQLLWQAAQHPCELSADRPVFLGQLHGAELPRLGATRAAILFTRMTGATYRPHPSERDAVSRLEHTAFERLGIEIDRSSSPLATINRPVAAAFSTGLLEAAARGLPAWAFYPSPPRWLSQFWERYEISTWGQEPTRVRSLFHSEPAQIVASAVTGL